MHLKAIQSAVTMLAHRWPESRGRERRDGRTTIAAATLVVDDPITTSVDGTTPSPITPGSVSTLEVTSTIDVGPAAEGASARGAWNFVETRALDIVSAAIEGARRFASSRSHLWLLDVKSIDRVFGARPMSERAVAGLSHSRGGSSSAMSPTRTASHRGAQ
jgi:hypothetical protein